MLTFKETNLAAPHVQSLQWTREGLTDWVSGGTLYRLDGTTRSSGMYIGYRFDSAMVSPSGRYSVIYERLGTKGVIFEGTKQIREINRSYYCAESYEFPIAFLMLDNGEEALAYCPKEYNQLEIEDVSTGKRITSSLIHRAEDFFHSRLRVNSISTLLVSVGWFWHPWLHVNVYDLVRALEQPESNESDELSPIFGIELNNAMFYGDTLMITSPSAPENNPEPLELSTPNTLGIFNVTTRGWDSIHPLELPIGLFFPLSLRYIVSFYEYPKVIDLHTGQVLHCWENLNTKIQESCITSEKELPPPFAMDSNGARFAVWQDGMITVVQFDRAQLENTENALEV